MSMRKTKEYTKKRKIIFKKEFIIKFYYIIILYLPYSIPFIIYKQRKIEFHDSSIYLKVKGGWSRILWSDFGCDPKLIYINGIQINNINRIQDLSEPENNVTIIWNVEMESTGQMFSFCYDIIEIDLSNFDSSKIKSMNNMFVSCNSLININFTNFKTSKVTDMSNLFVNCISLKSLDLSLFDTSNVETMFSMFHGCYSLTSLNLSYFNTSKVKEMKQMFFQCSNLTSLDLSHFNSSQVTTIDSMFYKCSSLKYLFLPNFNKSKISSITKVFYDCTSLEFVNIKGWDLTTDLIAQIKDLNLGNLTICDDKQNVFSNFLTYSQKMICADNIINNNNGKEFKCSLNFPFQYNEHSCELCGKYNYFQLFNEKDIYNSDSSYIKCSYNKDGYYLDNNDFLYKKCYFSCKTCNKNGNDLEHNCLECKEDYINEISVSGYKNCYKNNIRKSDIISSSIDDSLFIDNSELSDTFLNTDNDYNYNSEFSTNIFDSELNSVSNSYSNIFYDDTVIQIDNSNSDYLITDTIKNSYDTISYELITDNINKNTQIDIINESIDNIFEYLLNEAFLEEINKGIDKRAFKENLIFILTSTKNQKNLENENNITMDLGECENILKKSYGISLNESLYILQILSEEEGMKIPKLEYEVYYPFYDNNNNYNLTKLNLALCKDIKISVSIYVEINDTLDKYNPKSDYYNNICYKYTTESGTDICLKGRQNEFVEKNMSLCEENCELIDYNYSSKKVQCSCDIKLKVTENFDIKFNKKEFFKSFIDIKNLANLDVMKCYKIVMRKKELIKNYGCFIICFILLLYFITLIFFCFNSFKKLKKDIMDIIKALKNNNDLINEGIEINNRIINKNKNKKIKFKKRKKMKEIKNNYLTNQNNKNYNLENINDNNSDDNDSKKEYFSGQMTENDNNEGSSKQRIKIIGEIDLGLEGNNKNIFNNNNKKILELKDFEINSLEYEEALEKDNRNIFEYYLSLLKNNHPLSFSFGTFIDYNPLIIKKFLFFFSFSLDFTINTLFFNDDTMNKIYIDKGKYNFIYQIPQILYSTIISKFIDTFIRMFALSQDNIVELKQEKNKKELDNKYKKLIKKLKIKFILFFIFDFLVLGFFWYYITCFCGIYVNTQSHLIKDTVISFLTGLLLPFGLLLIPGIFRISALRDEKHDRKGLYKFSAFIESILG